MEETPGGWLVSATKKCTKCGGVKMLADFGKDKNRPDGLKSWCRSCRKVSQAAWYKQNRDVQAARVKDWALRHPEYRAARDARWRDKDPDRARRQWLKHAHRRRARKLALPSEPYTRDEIITRDGEACWMCGVTGLSLDVEHLIPLSASEEALSLWGVTNPGDVLANVSLACSPCNGHKLARIMVCAVRRYLRNIKESG